MAPPFVYLIFYAAYGLNHINIEKTIGDISYGIYIFAWPIQQVFTLCFPTLSPYGNIFFSSLIIISLALLSWHFVEKPMLSQKQKLFAINKFG